MAGRVAGKVAFITGAARGQGRSRAVRLAREDTDIIAIDACRPVGSGPEVPPPTPGDLAETADLLKGQDRRIVTDVVPVAQLKHVLPIGWVEPIGISNAGLFPASDEGRYITGVPLPVDAGSMLK